MAQAIFPPSTPLEAMAKQELLLQRPEMKKMLELDRKMANILSRTDISAEERAREYEKALLHFRTVREDVLINGTQLSILRRNEEKEAETPPIIKKKKGVTFATRDVQTDDRSEVYRNPTKPNKKLRLTIPNINDDDPENIEENRSNIASSDLEIFDIPDSLDTSRKSLPRKEFANDASKTELVQEIFKKARQTEDIVYMPNRKEWLIFSQKGHDPQIITSNIQAIARHLTDDRPSVLGGEHAKLFKKILPKLKRSELLNHFIPHQLENQGIKPPKYTGTVK